MIAPEATIVESFGEITILNQLDSVVPQKSEKLYQQLEIRNAQLEWKFHKSQAEIIELSIKLKDAIDAGGVLSSENQTLKEEVEDLRQNKGLQQTVNELESRLEHVNQTSKEEIERLEESLKQTKIQGEATQQLLVVRYEAEIDDLERRVKAATEEVQESRRKSDALAADYLALQTKYEDFRVSVAGEGNGITADSAQSFLQQHVRTLQERNANLAADLRLRSNTILDLEKAVRMKDDELVVLNRVKLRLESSLETQQYEIGLLEECKKKMTHELNGCQVSYDQLLHEKRRIESELHEYSTQMKESQNLIASLTKQVATSVESRVLVEKLDNALKSETELKEKLAFLEYELAEANAEIKQLTESLNSSQDLLSSTTAQLASVDSNSLNGFKKLQDKYEKELDELHAAFELERDEFEDQLAALSQAFEKRGEVVISLEKKVNVQSSEISFLRPELARKDKKISQLETEVAARKKENDDLCRMASQSSSRGAIITDLKADLNEKAKLHADLQSANVALSAAKSTTEIVQAEMKRLKCEHEDMLKQYEEAQETIDELSKTAAEEIDSRQEEISSLSLQLERKTASLTDVSKRLQDLSGLYDALLHRHSELVDERSEQTNPDEF